MRSDLSIPGWTRSFHACKLPTTVTMRLPCSGAGTNMGGDRLWECGLPYEILGTGFTVAAGDTLVIEPGVTMRFVTNSTLYVAGRLIAAGTPEEPITFSATNPTPGFWAGLNIIGSFANPATAVISHAVLEYGGSGPSGGNLRVENARAIVEYCRIQHSAAYGVHVSSSGVPKIVWPTPRSSITPWAG